MIDTLRLDRSTTRIEVRDWVLRLRRLAISTRCRLMGGHWRVLHVTRGHVALRCVACGQCSPGWDVGRRAGA